MENRLSIPHGLVDGTIVVHPDTRYPLSEIHTNSMVVEQREYGCDPLLYQPFLGGRTTLYRGIRKANGELAFWILNLQPIIDEDARGTLKEVASGMKPFESKEFEQRVELGMPKLMVSSSTDRLYMQMKDLGVKINDECIEIEDKYGTSAFPRESSEVDPNAYEVLTLGANMDFQMPHLDPALSDFDPFLRIRIKKGEIKTWMQTLGDTIQKGIVTPQNLRSFVNISFAFNQ